MPILDAAQTTLREEAAALSHLADMLENNATFVSVTQHILSLKDKKGRVIVTGVGKSGHIGGKIAATLASTGTPSFFVHPTEALHGDLGMITPDDLVMALSHSGESKELAAVLAYCQRFAIPLVAVTGAKSATQGSSLTKAATYVLNTGVEKEACPLNLAPTTSTTAALALADALAVALMTARGFGKTDFANFHPGGKLGAQLLRVKEVMITTNLPLQPQNASMAEVLVELTNKNLGCVGLTDAEGKLVGIFTDGDLKRRLLAANSADANAPQAGQGNHLLAQTAQQVMTPAPKSTVADAMAVAGVAQMQQYRIDSLWVVDDAHKPVGLFRLEECLARGVL